MNTFSCFNWKVQVTSPRKHIEENYVDYAVEIENISGDKWSLRKRYREFRDLHEKLMEDYPTLVGSWSFPPKLSLSNWFGTNTFSDSVIEERRNKLEEYLKKCIQNKTIASSPIVVTFLQEPQKPWTKDQLTGMAIGIAFVIFLWISIDFSTFFLAFSILCGAAIITKPDEASFHEYLRQSIAGNNGNWIMKNVYAPLAVTVLSMNSVVVKKDYFIMELIAVKLEDRNQTAYFIGIFKNWFQLTMPKKTK